MVVLEHVSKRFEGKRQVTALDDVSVVVETRGDGVDHRAVRLWQIDAAQPDRRAGSRDRQATCASTARRSRKLSDDDLTRVRRDKIGFIFQFFNLLPTLTCLENVGLPLHLRGWPRRKVDARARELLTLVQLGHRMEHLPEELSGGERQRVAIARALSVYPPIILADEPTGNLDTQHRRRNPRADPRSSPRLNTTIIVVTHDMKVAESCARTIALRDGKIVEDIRR